MIKKKIVLALMTGTAVLSLTGCQKYSKGTIYFALGKGETFPTDFGHNTTWDDSGNPTYSFLTGQANTPVAVDIPDPSKENYYFVGWREKKASGAYTSIKKYIDDEGKSCYYYPYGSTTFYPLFEPLFKISFDLTDAKDSNGVLVDPKLTTSSNSYVDGVLNGYSTMEIPSTDYLPTATGDHLSFQYWYTKYPLTSTTDADGITHYGLDTTSAEGTYQFSTSFGSNSMCFPTSADSTLTLYAKWTEDPTVTIHFNLDGITDDSFLAWKDTTNAKYETLQKQIEGLMKKNLGTTFFDANSGKGPYYYQVDSNSDGTFEIDKRFAGYYLDSDFKKQFNLTSSIGSTSIDLYLKWDSHVTVTLDYNGGKLNDKTTENFSYYEGDVLGTEFYNNHIPVKANASFTGWTNSGTAFNISTAVLSATDITLKANYDDYPTLNLVYSYPSSYPEASKVANPASVQLKAGTSLTDKLATFRSGISDEQLYAGKFTDQNNTDFTYFFMPNSDTTITLNLGYKLKLTFTYYSAASTSITGASDVIKYVGLDDLLNDSSDSLTSLKTLTIGTDTYTFAGFYSDAALTTLAFPIQGSSSATQPSKTIYVKMTL